MQGQEGCRQGGASRVGSGRVDQAGKDMQAGDGVGVEGGGRKGNRVHEGWIRQTNNGSK